MADKRRFLDVWIIDANTVYKEVPFNVVTDWIQQGRLLADDMLKPSGTKEWQRIGGAADFSPYLPQAQPHRVEDKAEALEPVEVGFSWRHRAEDEDDEVDMIPLIDVTLVLLIFFMMSAVVAASAQVDLPPARSAGVVTNFDTAGITIDLIGKGQVKETRYTISKGNVNSSDPEDQNIQTLGEALARLQVLLERNDHPVEVTINAHQDVKASLLLQLTVALEKRPLRDKITRIYRGAREQK